MRICHVRLSQNLKMAIGIAIAIAMAVGRARNEFINTLRHFNISKITNRNLYALAPVQVPKFMGIDMLSKAALGFKYSSTAYRESANHAIWSFLGDLPVLHFGDLI